MDNIFGVGLPEVVLILIIAGMVMGPERIVRAARTLGVLVTRLQKVGLASVRQLTAELDSADETGQVRSTAEEMKELHHQMAELRREILSLTTGVAVEGKQAIDEVRDELEHSIMPPQPTKKDTRIKPTPAKEPTLNPQGDSTVHRPPSLFPAGSAKEPRGVNGNGSSPVSPPPKLPTRTDILEDPN